MNQLIVFYQPVHWNTLNTQKSSFMKRIEYLSLQASCLFMFLLCIQSMKYPMISRGQQGMVSIAGFLTLGFQI